MLRRPGAASAHCTRLELLPGVFKACEKSVWIGRRDVVRSEPSRVDFHTVPETVSPSAHHDPDTRPATDLSDARVRNRPSEGPRAKFDPAASDCVCERAGKHHAGEKHESPQRGQDCESNLKIGLVRVREGDA